MFFPPPRFHVKVNTGISRRKQSRFEEKNHRYLKFLKVSLGPWRPPEHPSPCVVPLVLCSSLGSARQPELPNSSTTRHLPSFPLPPPSSPARCISSFNFGGEPLENLRCVGDGAVPDTVGYTHDSATPNPFCTPTNLLICAPKNTPKKASTLQSSLCS